MSKSFKKDLTGKRFGRLTVLEFVPNDKHHSHWKCICDCGNTCETDGEHLKNGITKSCGCFKLEREIEANIKHGFKGTRIYRTWKNMKNRCSNPKRPDYKNYGGRGISVCDEWRKDFMTFCKWAMNNGYQDNLTLDRIDVNGNYEPKNCRWVDMKTQARNRSNNIVVEYNGKKMTLAEVSEKSGITSKILYRRYSDGDRGERLFRTVNK